MVNGKPVKELGAKIDPQRDRVTVDGLLLKAKRKLYIALHKPRRYLSTCQAESGDARRIVLDLLPSEWRNLFPVGRLDYESEGLLFLTNDGDFSLRLTHPRYGVTKTYVVVVEGKVEESVLKKFTQGITHDGELLKAQKATLLSSSKSQSLVELELAEGKNREIRRLFESQNMMVLRLVRIKIGHIKIGELPLGKWRVLTEPEIKSLLSPL